MDEQKYKSLVNKEIDKFKEAFSNNEYIYIDVTTPAKSGLILDISIDRGGASGGNCYGDDASYYKGYTGSAPDLNNVVYNVLAEINEDISFLTARKIISDCTKTKYEKNREYYGNYTNNEDITFDFMNMYDLLKEKQLLPKEKGPSHEI